MWAAQRKGLRARRCTTPWACWAIWAAPWVWLWLGAPLKRTGAHWHAAVTTSCGVVALAALAAMAAPALDEVRGLSQRVGEAAVFGWMLFTATRPPPAAVG